MTTLISNTILWLHILAGFTAFLVAPGALATRKGGTWHRRWGKIFFGAMAGVTITALLLTSIRPNSFLTLVALFSFYSAFSGYRVLYRKRPDLGQRAKWFDWAAALITLFAGMGMFYLGFFGNSSGAPVFIIFGMISTMLGAGDIHSFLRRFHPVQHKYDWLYTHIGNMIGAYIAAVTAFAVVNLDFLPMLIRWLLPTLVGTPAIFLWIRVYRKKFAVYPVMTSVTKSEKIQP